VITALDAKANRATCCSRLLEIGDNMVSSGVLNICFLPLDPQPRPPPRGKAMLELVPQIISCLSFLVYLFPPDARKQKPGSEGSKGVSAPRQLSSLELSVLIGVLWRDLTEARKLSRRGAIWPTTSLPFVFLVGLCRSEASHMLICGLGERCGR
jgi:hypothetical protein